MSKVFNPFTPQSLFAVCECKCEFALQTKLCCVENTFWRTVILGKLFTLKMSINWNRATSLIISNFTPIELSSGRFFFVVCDCYASMRKSNSRRFFPFNFMMQYNNIVINLLPIKTLRTKINRFFFAFAQADNEIIFSCQLNEWRWIPIKRWSNEQKKKKIIRRWTGKYNQFHFLPKYYYTKDKRAY